MTEQQEYKVLARKYRPQNFEDLIGQDVLVRTLKNAFEQNKIAHAFLFTGIRGVGKTTTARIIARMLNCEQGPTINPCGVCDHCKMISEDRHMDVLEMDAASRTGVDDIREIIESVKYKPTQAKYKIYIIDEVHMLSNSAFNALLKTLEEPPEHVKFVFATTELNKVPVTVISRCQSFSLKRVSDEELAAHLGKIAGKEEIKISEKALMLIAAAAGGSVRDSLSIMDQAKTQAPAGEEIGEDIIRDMLGMSDKSAMIDFTQKVFAGDAAAALEDFKNFYLNGVEPAKFLGDVLDFIHFMAKVKVSAELADDINFSEGETEKAKELAAKLQMADITAVWQILSKSAADIKSAHNSFAHGEMAIIKICYAASADASAAKAAPIAAKSDAPDLVKSVMDNFEGASIVSVK